MSSAVSGARKALLWLAALVVAIFGLLTTGVLTGNTSFAPGLALDLAGGRQIILEAQTLDDSAIEQSDLEQAVEIIRQRVDATGVAEAEIATAGETNIIVSLPGNPSEDTLALVRTAAQLQFRPVLTFGDPAPFDVGDLGDSELPAQPEPDPDNPSDLNWLTTDVYEEFAALDCFDAANRAGADLGDPNAGHVACAADGSAKYALGPVELSGEDIDTAASGPELGPTGAILPGRFEVRLELTGEGGGIFADTTRRLSSLPSPQNQFAILLDGVVISAPSVENSIPGGTASITGGFTQQGAETLANQLKFGALPLNLEVQSEQQISATKGADELRNGMLAGLIGLILVVVYTVFQYRALGTVTIGSLLVAGGLTYGIIALLSWGLGYRLSLAGVAGLIVAIGITADSFIVYFERVKDELREGRSLQAAVEHGWKRARRTILASDAVSFLAALVLYILAVGNVRGFAFTLGLTTVIDLLVVVAFTHPVLALLSRTKFFGNGHPWSGLDPRQLGREAMYKGRGRVRTAGADAPTLAQRKAEKAKAAASAKDGE